MGGAPCESYTGYLIPVSSVDKQGVGDISFDTSHHVSVGKCFDLGSL